MIGSTGTAGVGWDAHLLGSHIRSGARAQYGSGVRVVDHVGMTVDSANEGAAAEQRALRTAVTDIEGHVATLGWDRPVGVYSLVRTAAAVRENPGITSELPPGATEAAAGDPAHLLSVEQDSLPQADTLEDLLAQLAWPSQVDGAAISIERVVVPPEAEVDMPADAQEALDYLESHPERQDVRIVVGVLRSGESWCALRSRNNDADDQVAQSADAVPGLVAALRATFG